MIFYYVYILKSLKDQKLYIGFTKDLKKRLEYHNKGWNRSTQKRKPFQLLFYEGFRSEKDARKREAYFKTGYGREEIKVLLRETLKNDKAGIV